MSHTIIKHPLKSFLPALIASIICGTFAPAGIVFAQTSVTSDKNTAEKKQVGVLDAVKVNADAVTETTEGSGSYTTESTATATGLKLSVRDTPQSVSVVTRERIDDQAMKTVADALLNTTGVSVKPVDRGRNNISVRGFDVDNFQFDGVPVATGNVGIETDNTAIYDRVEVVRGATGLLSGAGSPSAAINLVRKHADSNTFTGTISIEAGSWDHRSGTLDLTTPLNEDGSIRGRFVASITEKNSFIDLEHKKNTVFYGVIDADLSAATHLSVGASDQRDDRSGVIWAGLPYWYSDGSRTDWDRSKTTAADWNTWNTQEQTFFATLKHEFDNKWLIQTDITRNNTSDKEKMLWISGDPDRDTGLGMSAYGYKWDYQPKQSHIGIIATGPFELFGRNHELTVGFVKRKDEGGWDVENPLDGSDQLSNFNTWDGSGYPEPTWGASYRGSLTTTTESAAYTATRLQLTDELKLILGGRFSNWKQEEHVAVWTATAYEIKHDVFTPYAGAVYDLSDEVSAYASYSDIFKPQNNRDRYGKYLDPLSGATTEIGLKKEFLDNTLNASAAIFQTKQDNYAMPDVGYFVPGTANIPASYSTKGVDAKGYEFEVAGEITADWNVNLGWTQYSAKDAKDTEVAVDHSRKLLKLFTKYKLQGAWSGLSVGGGLNWENDRPATAANPATGLDEKVGQPAYALANLMTRYEFDKQLSLQLNINNVFDKKYRSGSFWWGAPYTYGEPRNALLTLDYKFN